jgi:type II secretory pathway pseudopilin PulG
MKSTKCFECGFVGWADAEFCKKCGAMMQQRSADPVAGDVRQEHDYNQPGAPGVQHQELKTGLAYASMVIGIISIFTCGGLMGPGAIAGLVFGIIAMVKASRFPSIYGGKGPATAGIVCSAFALVFIVPMALAIAIPNLFAARRAANEGSSISVLRTIAGAEATYQEQHGRYADLDELAADHLVPAEIVSSSRNGYRFAVSRQTNPEGFQATGTPDSYPTSGLRSFYIDETGVVRAEDLHGAMATKLSRPLDDPYSRSPRRRTSD